MRGPWLLPCYLLLIALFESLREAMEMQINGMLKIKFLVREGVGERSEIVKNHPSS
jgi:hypothetical protein